MQFCSWPTVLIFETTRCIVENQIIETHFIETQELIENLSTLCTYAVSGTCLQFNYYLLKMCFQLKRTALF